MPAFLVDENLPGALAEALKAAGHQAESVSNDKRLRSLSDGELMVHAKLRGLIIISKDKDFSDITQYPAGSHPGVVCVRLPNKMVIGEQVRLVVAAISAVDPNELRGSLVILEAGSMRLRKA
ncbi:MAG: DUF5615 family PIN-like protein [Candidatus Eisenbacteria bacterium]|nr:DUF5615 family PIN-like protein [Candidatus Eisenbacteria bacterium]